MNMVAAVSRVRAGSASWEDLQGLRRFLLRALDGGVFTGNPEEVVDAWLEETVAGRRMPRLGLAEGNGAVRVDVRRFATRARGGDLAEARQRACRQLKDQMARVLDSDGRFTFQRGAWSLAPGVASPGPSGPLACQWGNGREGAQRAAPLVSAAALGDALASLLAPRGAAGMGLAELFLGVWPQLTPPVPWVGPTPLDVLEVEGLAPCPPGVSLYELHAEADAEEVLAAWRDGARGRPGMRRLRLLLLAELGWEERPVDELAGECSCSRAQVSTLRGRLRERVRDVVREKDLGAQEAVILFHALRSQAQRALQREDRP